ncbi:MAG: sensor histidine kinase [Micromonosporaceae bacterium]
MTQRARRIIEPSAVPLAVLVLVIQIVFTSFAWYGSQRGFGPPGGPGPGPGPGDPGPWMEREPFNTGRLAPDWLAYLLLTLGPLALLVRRRFPVPVLVTTAAVTIGYLVLGYSYGPVFLAAAAALISAVVHGQRVAAWLTGVVGLAVYFPLEYAYGRDPKPTLGNVGGTLAWLLVFLLVAEALRFRRERAATAEQRRADEARRIADTERLRIARELHDVLAHNISMINIQAGVALHLSQELPESQLPGQVRDALTAIKQASQDTLRELRATLGVLRRVDEDAPRSPTPSLDRLDDLVAGAAGPGLSVRTEITGTPRPLPAGVDLAAYRIVQEALTNVHRHAAATTATIRLAYGPDTLTITVEDDGAGGTGNQDGSGTGIAGMRERATALGGTLEAGRRLSGGFRVRATLPVPPSS